MLTRHQKQRFQLALLIGGLTLAVYYVGYYRPLHRRLVQLDTNLYGIWTQMSNATFEYSGVISYDLQSLSNRLEQVNTTLQAVRSAARLAASQIELEPDIRGRMRAPFQLVEFQNDRQVRIETLSNLAATAKVTLDPGVFRSFPEYTATNQRPSLLWAQLALVDHVLSAAIQCHVSAVHALHLPPPEEAVPFTVATPILDQIPIEIELSGSMDAISDFLSSLPLRAEQARALGLPIRSSSKPALFIDRILTRKRSPENPDEVHLVLRLSGFVVHD